MSRIQPQRNLNTLFRTRFDPYPRPVNCTTFTATDVIIKDERHPLNIPLSRRLDEWNPKRLHWAIRTPLVISKKRTIRSWVGRRFRDTFIDELRISGFNRWGEPLVPSKLKSPLTGALAITLLQPAISASVQDLYPAEESTISSEAMKLALSLLALLVAIAKGSHAPFVPAKTEHLATIVLPTMIATQRPRRTEFVSVQLYPVSH
ncbi:hypothetical protein E4T44_06689 [Aureobasidium sp. EXF-8845]|nr:hypothetical protein E4T44_06689 [Aureobasidium sp. EXF-8845]KAI4854465.1 hypothetical protein E4T45_03954 [Aureobasidium sp. EXF-8846]